jgi:hypothetical protein
VRNGGRWLVLLILLGPVVLLVAGTLFEHFR